MLNIGIYLSFIIYIISSIVVAVGIKANPEKFINNYNFFSAVPDISLFIFIILLVSKIVKIVMTSRNNNNNNNPLKKTFNILNFSIKFFIICWLISLFIDMGGMMPSKIMHLSVSLFIIMLGLIIIKIIKMMPMINPVKLEEDKKLNEVKTEENESSNLFKRAITSENFDSKLFLLIFVVVSFLSIYLFFSGLEAILLFFPAAFVFIIAIIRMYLVLNKCRSNVPTIITTTAVFLLSSILIRMNFPAAGDERSYLWISYFNKNFSHIHYSNVFSMFLIFSVVYFLYLLRIFQEKQFLNQI